MIRTIGVLLLLTVPALAAEEQATVTCARMQLILDNLQKKYQEIPVSGGAAGEDGQMPALLTLSPQGTWTFLMSPKPGVLCPIAAGQGWTDFPKETH